MSEGLEPELPPMVLRAEAAVEPRPWPGFWAGALLTFGYWVVLIGGMLAVVVLGVIAAIASGDQNALNPPDDGSNSVDKMPAAIRSALAWSFPAGYFCGLIYSLIVLRVVVGRSWVRAIGLTRLPPYHLLLGVLALPAFMILSDGLARSLQPMDEFIHRITRIPGTGDSDAALQALFADFHWSFAVLAIGLGPGVVEELWCRGFLGRGFIGRYGWIPGIGLSSAFFGMLHLWPPSYVIVTAVMGACLHYAYAMSRSLWVPIAIHFANNSFAALVSVNAVSTAEVDASLAANPAPAVALAVSLMLVCGLAMRQSRWSWRNERPGEFLPPAQSDVVLTAARPNPLLALAAFACSAALLGLLLG